MPTDLYAVLGLPRTASEEEVKAAYKQLAVRVHPDRNPEGKETFQVVSEAYQTLSQPQTRNSYDLVRHERRTREVLAHHAQSTATAPATTGRKIGGEPSPSSPAEAAETAQGNQHRPKGAEEASGPRKARRPLPAEARDRAQAILTNFDYDTYAQHLRQ
eukprot:TRINITY_DN725_c0_g2_i1.p1 TRINITY_DN725_c0_g2~~TRINITY_DN725_c0_g2_i1.p1  ORF type:complete len:159 (-),score=27.34 TRINITY_DN725_c0_g2_i1:155-631(-)